VSEAIQNVRFRPLGRGTFVGGFFVTLAIHAALGGLVWYGNVKDEPRPEQTRDILITQMVKLNTKREQFWLPRITEPPRPKVEEPTIKVTDNLEAKPVEKEKEKKEKPKDPEISKSVQDVLNRRRALLQNAIEESNEGDSSGSAAGTSNTAVEGDPYATLIYEAIRRNWNVPSGLGSAMSYEAEVRISIDDDGTMRAPRMARSSGNQLFDDSCLQAIQATRQVPPPPANQRARYRRGVVLAFDGKDLAR
jgi:colicin import membrane protein